MKKFYTLFISLILLMASVTFIACQTNAEENKDDDKATEYTITINAPNGTVEFDKTKAKAGETVKLTKLEADDGYTFKTMSIKKENGDDVTEVDRQNQTFTMPESNVTVSATFEKTETPKANEYGFISSETYTVVFTNGSSTTMTGEALTNAAKDTGMVNGTDYTINGKTVTLTASGMAKIGSYLGNGGNSSGGDDTPMTYTLIGEEDNAAKYILANLPTIENPSEYAKGDTVTFSIKTKTGETPTGLYLVIITIKKRYIGDVLDIPVTYNKENHTVSFEMPDNDVMVRADFEDVVCRAVDVEAGDSAHFPNWFDVTTSNVDTTFQVALRFDTKEYDNLERFNGIYKFELCNLIDIYDNPEDWKSGAYYSYWFYIQLGKDHSVYDYNTKYYKYYENPVVIYNGEMYEPVIDDTLGSRFVNLDSQN